MICLFFDTSSDLLKVSLIKDDKIIFDKELHTIDEAFKSNNIDFKELDEIIVGNGPGSFTGTRISIAVAKTYAFSFNIPVYMISSLEELIYDNDRYDFYVPIIEEKKDNLYFSIFDKNKKRVMDDTYSSIEYMYKKLEELDGYISEILNAVKEAGIWDETIFILTADHGGINKGHGGKTMEEMQTPFIISGKNIKKGYNFTESMMQFDVASTIAYIFKLEQPQVWIGRPMKQVFK